MAHLHSLYDTDPHFKINPDTRAIKNESTTKTKLIQGDHNSERFTFELPRRIDGHDMMLCNRVYVNYQNIDSTTKEVHKGRYEVTDMQLSPADSEIVICSWLVSGNATKAVGVLYFNLSFMCVTAEVDYKWNTEIHTGINVSAGMDDAEEFTELYVDVLEQWREELFGINEDGVTSVAEAKKEALAEVQTESAAQQKLIEEKTAESLASIPDDYTEMYNNGVANTANVESLKREKSSAIIQKSSGKSIVAKDSSNDPLRGLTLYGKTKQFTTTGKNLLNLPDVESYELNGVTWSCKNGVVTAKGTASVTSATSRLINYDIAGMKGTFTLSGAKDSLGVFVNVIQSDGTSKYYSSTFSLDGTEKQVNIYCQVYVEKTVDTTVYPMLNSGTEALPWEPYTGGKPSPNPDYPQELEDIGKWGNLFDISTAIEGFYVNSSGEEIAGLTLVMSDFIQVDGSEYITWSSNANVRSIGLVLYDGNKTFIKQLSSASVYYITAELTTDVKFIKCFISVDSSPLNINRLIPYEPMLNYGSSALPWRPYTGKKEVDVEIYGKNLLDEDELFDAIESKIPPDSNYIKSLTSDRVNRTFTMTGIPAKVYVQLNFEISVPKIFIGKTLYFDYEKAGNEPYLVLYQVFNDNSYTQFINNSAVIDEDCKCLRLAACINRSTINESATYSATYSNLRLTLLSGEEYEPYRSKQSLIYTNTLPGIPLGATIPTAIANSPDHMSGVWFDEEEQQYYIGDTVDYERGVYVQRIGNDVVSFTENSGYFEEGNCYAIYRNLHKIIALNIGAICEKAIFSKKKKESGLFLENSSNFTFVGTPDDTLETMKEKYGDSEIYYILAEPIEIPLEESDIASYNSIHSNYPTTVVQNDCDAYMDVKYNADPENYIEQNYVSKAVYEEMNERLQVVEERLAAL